MNGATQIILVSYLDLTVYDFSNDTAFPALQGIDLSGVYKLISEAPFEKYLDDYNDRILRFNQVITGNKPGANTEKILDPSITVCTCVDVSDFWHAVDPNAKLNAAINFHFTTETGNQIKEIRAVYRLFPISNQENNRATFTANDSTREYVNFFPTKNIQSYSISAQVNTWQQNPDDPEESALIKMRNERWPFRSFARKTFSSFTGLRRVHKTEFSEGDDLQCWNGQEFVETNTCFDPLDVTFVQKDTSRNIRRFCWNIHSTEFIAPINTPITLNDYIDKGGNYAKLANQAFSSLSYTDGGIGLARYKAIPSTSAIESQPKAIFASKISNINTLVVPVRNI